MAKKLDLTIANPSKGKSYGAWTAGYRQSTNVEDRRDSMGMARAAQGAMEEIYSQEAKMPRKQVDTSTPRGRATNNSDRTPSQRPIEDTSDNTPDDYATSDVGGRVSQTTPSSAYKASAEEAIRKTHIERK